MKNNWLEIYAFSIKIRGYKRYHKFAIYQGNGEYIIYYAYLYPYGNYDNKQREYKVTVLFTYPKATVDITEYVNTVKNGGH